MKRLSAREAPGRDDRPATHVLHDSADVRVVAFHLQSGQEVEPHRSPSTVLLQVIEGEGVFSGADSESRLTAGEAALFDRDEIHGIRAVEGTLRFLAIITPRPA